MINYILSTLLYEGFLIPQWVSLYFYQKFFTFPLSCPWLKHRPLSQPVITFLFWFSLNGNRHAAILSSCAGDKLLYFCWHNFSCNGMCLGRRTQTVESGGTWRGCFKDDMCWLLYLFFFQWLLEAIIDLQDEIGKLKRSKSRECSHVFSTSPLTHLILKLIYLSRLECDFHVSFFLPGPHPLTFSL